MAVREIKPGVFDVVVHGALRDDGSRPRATKRVRGSRRDAERVETALKAARDMGRLIGPTDTLGAYMAEWLRTRQGEIENQTYSNYQAAIRRLAPYVGKLKLSDVRPSDVRNAYRSMRASGLSGTTCRHAHRVLAMIFKRAVQDREIDVSPIDAVKPPRVDTVERVALSEAEVVELLTLLKGSSVWLPALVAYDTGLRLGELLGLKWADLDPETGVLRVERSVEQFGGVVQVKRPKTARSRRVVALSGPALNALKEHRTRQLQRRARYANLWRDEGFIFPSVMYHSPAQPMGRCWTPTAFGHAWRRAMNEANGRRMGEFVAAGGMVEDFECWEFGVHRLRHTFATHALRGGLRVEIVSRALGHSSSAVTSMVYSHVIDGEQTATAAVTGKVLEGLD